jgi:HTH-type transcriptional regulator/antitoxin HipB
MLQDTFFDELARIVIYHRKSGRLNRVELARLAGVGKTVVYDIEHAKKTVRLDTVVKILKVLNIKIELTGPLMQTYRELSR